MSKTQIWTVIILGAFVILFFAQVLLKDDKSTIPAMGSDDLSVTESESSIDGNTLMQSFGCNRCHGNDLRGTALAPTLWGVFGNYDREKLINYLIDPSSNVDKERFLVFKQRFSSEMPSYGDKDPKEIGMISDFLLNLK